MCSMCSCSDQRSQNNLLRSLKGVESRRMQYKGFWKSQKIPGLDFWESRDRDFENIPGYPGILQEPAHNIETFHKKKSGFKKT